MLLPQPKIVIPTTNFSRDNLRQKAHDIGLEIIKDRQLRGDYRPLGVHPWTQKVRESGTTADEPTVRKRINELAQRSLWNAAPWVHLPVYYEDEKPSFNYRSVPAMQSSYLPSPLLFPEWESYCLRATKFTDVLEFLDFVHPDEITV
jgi:hypothetical protein